MRGRRIGTAVIASRCAEPSTRRSAQQHNNGKKCRTDNETDNERPSQGGNCELVVSGEPHLNGGLQLGASLQWARLITVTVQALSGALYTAKAALATLTKGQPDSQYTAAAKQWLDEYTKAKDDGKACAAVQPIFDKNEELWKITDHFGYNHPALAAEQVCYKP